MGVAQTPAIRDVRALQAISPERWSVLEARVSAYAGCFSTMEAYMRAFSGQGFSISEDGAVTRTITFTDITELGGVKGARQASADIRRFLSPLADKLRAGGQLEPSERAALANASAIQAEIAAALGAAETANEADREEARRIAGGGRDADAEASDRARRAAGLRGSSTAEDLSRARPVSDRTFAGMFGDSARSMDSWGDGCLSASQEFCRAVAFGLSDSRLRAAAMDGNIGGAGGFAVPPAIFGRWLDLALESEIVRPRAQVWPITQGRERQIPGWDMHDRSDGSIAGFAIDWEGENPSADATPQVGETRLITLRARRGAIYASASNELVQDGFDFDAQLQMVMSSALGYGLDQSFFFGTGTGPVGIYQSAVLISVTRATANLIDYSDLTSMFSRLSPASIANSVWVAHSSTIPMLAALTIPTGTGGSHVPVMSESSGQFRILTRPVIFSEKVKPLGQLGDIGLFDFSRYAIGMRMDAALDKSIHVGFLKNQQYFRLQIRIDGQPVDAHPTTPPNSAPTQSPFVALAA
jgi:HK97 family phage major capsid protein